MKKVIKGLVLILAGTGLIGCDNSSGGDSDHYCSSSTANDYDRLSLKCQFASSESSLQECESEANIFLAKNPGLNCKVKIFRSKEEVTLRASDIRGFIEARRTSIYEEELDTSDDFDGSRCDVEIELKLNNLKRNCKFVTKHQCKQHIEDFSAEYPDINCVAQIYDSKDRVILNGSSIREFLSTIDQ